MPRESVTTTDCRLLQFLDHLDEVDLYLGHFRVPVTIAMLFYIVLHACGVLS